MTDLRQSQNKSQHRSPEHTEGGECTCASPEEHALMVAGVDDSFVHDKERAKMRQERNTHALRMKVLAETNGHNSH